MDDEPECEGFERVDRGDVRYKLGPDALPWSNGVSYARWRPDEVVERANEIVVDARGNIYLDGADFNFTAGASPEPGYIKLVTPDGQLRPVLAFGRQPRGGALKL